MLSQSFSFGTSAPGFGPMSPLDRIRGVEKQPVSVRGSRPLPRPTCRSDPGVFLHVAHTRAATPAQLCLLDLNASLPTTAFRRRAEQPAAVVRGRDNLSGTGPGSFR